MGLIRVYCKFCIKIGGSANAIENAKICICNFISKIANESTNAKIYIYISNCTSKSANVNFAFALRKPQM